MSLSGQATISSLDVANPTFDAANSGPAPSIPPFTFVTRSSSLSSVPTAVILPSPTGNVTSSSGASTGSTKVSAGVIVGISVGVFAALAIGLVIWMSVRHKRQMARRPKGNRKSWNKLDDNNNSPSRSARKGTMVSDVPMQTVEKSTRPPPLPVPFQSVKVQSSGGSATSPTSPATPIIADHPYSRNTRSVSHVLSNPVTAAPLPNHPFAAANISSQPRRPGEDGNNIPNPFLSRSPSNSSAYHSLYHTTVADHDASALSAFPAVQMALRLNSVASSGDYTEDKSPSPTQSHYPDISSVYLDVERQAPRKSYESSLYEQHPTGAHEEFYPPTHLFSQSNYTAPSSTPPGHKAIQDIITALDGDRPPPTTWKSNHDNRGSSRLSLGEGLVDTSMTFDPARQSQTSHRTAQTDHDLDMDSFPLPPPNNAALNPFRDRH